MPMRCVGEPRYAPMVLADKFCGHALASAIGMALYCRERTGQGQYIDVSLLDAQLSWLTYAAGNFFATGQDPARYGSAHPSIVPYQPFATADGYLMLAVGNDRLWQRFCEVAGSPELATRDGFATSAERVVNREEVVALVAAIMRERTTAAWMRVLEGAGIPAGPINTVAQALADPHVLAREMVTTVEHPTAGKVSKTGLPAKFTETPGEVRSPPPLLGQNTDEILRALGYDEPGIAALREQKVV